MAEAEVDVPGMRIIARRKSEITKKP